jgi:glyoxylase-like metal-dependent hydrolase (beta-lactamase superfamily II)
MKGERVPTPTRVSRIVPAHLDQEALSVVVFGPGRGEAIVVRLPDGRVGVVDGCTDPLDENGRGDPVREILAEFAELSDDPESFRLSFVCLTHPHDDHYAGLADLLRAYRGRIDNVWTVEAISGRYVDILPVSLKALWAGKTIARGDDEPERLRDVAHEIQKAANETGTTLLYLSRDKMLLRRARIKGADLEVVAWAPVDRDMMRTLEALKAALKKKADEEAIPRHDPNVMSGAVLLEWGDARILLAGDLLCGAREYLGWSGVRDHVEGPVQIVNVAHHASLEAHDEALWTKIRPELAIVTPFQHAAGSQPPRPEQIEKLLGASTVAITSPPRWEGMAGAPRPMVRRRTAKRSLGVALDVVPRPARPEIYNAVGVSIDSSGQITRFVLGGSADVFVK